MDIEWLCKSAWAAITKYHRLGGLNSGHLFITVLEPKKTKIKVPMNWVPDDALFLSCRWLPSLVVFIWQRERPHSGSPSSYNDTNLITDGIVTPVGLTAQHWTREDYCQALKSNGVCFAKFWTCLGPATSFFSPISPLCNKNVYPIPVSPLHFENMQLIWFHGFIVEEEFGLRINHNLEFH